MTSDRANDTQFEGADNQYAGPGDAPHQTQRLDAIQVFSNPVGSWQLLRQYNLTYDYSLLSDALVGYGCAAGQAKCADPNFPRLTLKSIQRVGNNGTSGLPATTFSYGAFSVVSANGNYWIGGAANRLTQVDNGQGGVLTLAYANIGQIVNNSLLGNQRRVTSKTLNDGQEHTYTWTYTYGTPSLNSLGITRGGQSPWGGSGGWGPQTYPNSAALYYNAFTDVLHNSQDWLAHKPLKEFRGHDWTQETDPNGTRTKHFFYQGEALDHCVPTATGGSITADACFLRLRDGEVLKGKEYKTQVLPGSGSAPLQESLHSFGVVFYDYSATPLAGLWRAFSYESQSSTKTYDPTDTSAAPSVQTTAYTYDVTENTNSNGGIYGNLSREELFDTDGNRQRVTKHFYAIYDTASVPATGSPYIVDHTWADYTWDGSFQTLAYTAYLTMVPRKPASARRAT